MNLWILSNAHRLMRIELIWYMENRMRIRRITENNPICQITFVCSGWVFHLFVLTFNMLCVVLCFIGSRFYSYLAVSLVVFHNVITYCLCVVIVWFLPFPFLFNHVETSQTCIKTQSCIELQHAPIHSHIWIYKKYTQ